MKRNMKKRRRGEKVESRQSGERGGGGGQTMITRALHEDTYFILDTFFYYLRITDDM